MVTWVSARADRYSILVSLQQALHGSIGDALLHAPWSAALPRQWELEDIGEVLECVREPEKDALAQDVKALAPERPGGGGDELA